MFRYKPPTTTPQSFASARPGTVRPLQSSHLWITFAIHLEDVALVREPVEQRRRHALALEHLAPLPERQVARQQQAPAFVAVREHLEEQFGAGPAEREAPQFVHDQRIETLQGGQEAVEAVLLLDRLQLRDQGGGRDELHAPAEPAQGQAQCRGEVRLARAAAADQAAVVVLLEPRAAGEFEDLLLGQARRGGEVEGVEVLEHGEGRSADARRDGVGRTRGHFQFGEPQQVGVAGLIPVGRFTGQFLPLGRHRRQAQLLQVGLQLGERRDRGGVGIGTVAAGLDGSLDKLDGVLRQQLQHADVLAGAARVVQLVGDLPNGQAVAPQLPNTCTLVHRQHLVPLRRHHRRTQGFAPVFPFLKPIVFPFSMPITTLSSTAENSAPRPNLPRSEK